MNMLINVVHAFGLLLGEIRGDLVAEQVSFHYHRILGRNIRFTLN